MEAMMGMLYKNLHFRKKACLSLQKNSRPKGYQPVPGFAKPRRHVPCSRGAHRSQSEVRTFSDALRQPWCVCFVSWCFFAGGSPIRTQQDLHHSARSRNIETRLHDLSNFHDFNTVADLEALQPADILVRYRCGKIDTPGHIELGHSVHPHLKELCTIEGNKQQRVFADRYQIRHDGATGLIRGYIGRGCLV